MNMKSNDSDSHYIFPYREEQEIQFRPAAPPIFFFEEIMDFDYLSAVHYTKVMFYKEGLSFYPSHQQLNDCESIFYPCPILTP